MNGACASPIVNIGVNVGAWQSEHMHPLDTLGQSPPLKRFISSQEGQWQPDGLGTIHLCLAAGRTIVVLAGSLWLGATAHELDVSRLLGILPERLL